MNKIRAIVKHPTEPFGHMISLDNDLNTFQRIVGGYIETVTLSEGLVMICNEEGVLLKLARNCFVRQKLGYVNIWHDVLGTIVVVGAKEDDFTDVPITLQEWQEHYLRR